MASMTKAQKQLERANARERRRAASGEVMGARMRTGIGFAAAYVGTQVLPSFAPTLAANQQLVDLTLAAAGGYFAFTDDSEIGDYATGAALVGLTQTLDNLGTRIQEFIARP